MKRSGLDSRSRCWRSSAEAPSSGQARPSPTPGPVTAIKAARHVRRPVGRDGREPRRPRPGLADPGDRRRDPRAGRRDGDRPRRRDPASRLHRQPHAPDRRGGRQLRAGLLRGPAAAGDRAGLLRRALRAPHPRGRLHDGARRRLGGGHGRRPAQRDRRGPHAGPAHARRAVRPRRHRRPLRQHGLPAADLRPGAGGREGDPPRRRRGPPGRAPRRQVRRRTSSRCAPRAASCRSATTSRRRS